MPRRLIAWNLLVVTAAASAAALLHGTAPEPLDVANGTPLRAGYSLEAPYAFRDTNGSLRGESVDTLRAALQRAGLPEPVWVHVEFPRLLHALRSGHIDVIAAGMFITSEHTAQAAFTRPTTSVRMGLLVPAGNPLRLHAFGDLRAAGPAAKLAVVGGSVELDRAREAGLSDAQLLRLPDTDSALAALQSGQAAAVALSVPALRWAVRTQPTLELAAPFAVPQHQGHSDIGFPAYAFRIGDPRRDRLDQALSGYLGSPDHLHTAAQYGFGADDIAAAHGLDPSRLGRRDTP